MIEFLTELVQTGTAMQDLVAKILSENIEDFELIENNGENRKEFTRIRTEVDNYHQKLNDFVSSTEKKNHLKV